MKKVGESFEFSATDLVGFLNCHHLAGLDRAVAEGKLAKPKIWDPLLEVLAQRGSLHERGYVEHLAQAGFEPVHIGGFEVSDAAIAETKSAMRSGASVIVQAALAAGGWRGRVDVLLRVEVPSALGRWSYEPVDTKLARDTKAGAIIQLCLYADLLTQEQGSAPEHLHVVAPWSDFRPQTFRYADYAAYCRKAKRAMQSMMRSSGTETYPEPVAHCDICRWRRPCDQRRHRDDHLCLVANISKIQINELRAHGVQTLQALSAVPLPLPWKPDRGSVESYTRIREQARIVMEARSAAEGRFEILPVEVGFGLASLPEPSEGDIFLDFEGDPFAGEHGQEYLFGYVFRNTPDSLSYIGNWALTRADEKLAFQTFVDFVISRWERFPDLHIYHYAPYEPAALKRLMGRYATREEEIDRMLRSRIFVDLYQVTRRAVRASVESYSIKQLESFYGFRRALPLQDANVALAEVQSNLELGNLAAISEEAKSAVQSYNEDDCRSAAALRDWLELHRQTLIRNGTPVSRPARSDDLGTEDLSARALKVKGLIERLTADVPADREQRSEEQQARWILSNVLDWHRREDKAVWWEYFRLADLAAEDMLDERAALSGLIFMGTVGGTSKAPIDRYRFPPQETDIRGGEELRAVGGAKFGKVDIISFAARTVDIKKRKDTATLHPEAVFAHDHVNSEVMADSLLRLGEHVVNHGLQGEGAHWPARDLLLREHPRTGGEPLHRPGETTVASAIRLCSQLAGGILPIQGPPGAGKTFTASKMICELVRLGKKVGITANSHAVIRNVIDETIKSADEQGIALQCCQKAGEAGHPQPRLIFAEKNEELLGALRGGTDVAGGTAWLWSRPDALESVDVLFVDEAAQMSLANVLAVSQAAKTVVLIGDPQQLDQPMKGSHPEGTGVSALHHILEGAQTISSDQGLFLEETWRLHPDVCAYTSELFYAGQLRSRGGLDKQLIKGFPPLARPGLHYIPVLHTGNQNCSPEEAQAVEALVRRILEIGATWTDRDGSERPIGLDDIVVITPYNAQVFEIKQRLPEARVGTVDKFQGQQAPIAIYSTATSSHLDAPRGMEFLYSLNRLNVATSRAKCVCILVSSPTLFEAECRTPRQIQLLNAFCRYLEVAQGRP